MPVLATAAVVLVLAGCGSAATPVGAEPPLATPAAPEPAPGPAEAARLWSLPVDEEGTQRIVRLRYEGPGDDGTLYLTLRLERADRYNLEAHARLLGKSVFRLMVRERTALFLDLQSSEYCRFDRAIEISAVPLGPLPFDVLPALLLGRVPARPDASGPVLQDGGDWTFRDLEGRRWTVRSEEGRAASWTLWRDETPAVWWSRDGDDAYLSAREEGLQLRWRVGNREPLARPLEEPSVPEGFAPGSDCG